MFDSNVKQLKVKYVGENFSYTYNNETKSLINGKVYKAYTSPVKFIDYIFVICEEGLRVGIPPKQLEILKD